MEIVGTDPLDLGDDGSSAGLAKGNSTVSNGAGAGSRLAGGLSAGGDSPPHPANSTAVTVKGRRCFIFLGLGLNHCFLK
jgi:hypothetical protein